MQQKQQHPEIPVSLLGHSDGSGVILAAAEQLPPETLDRIVLFAPGVSVDYDFAGHCEQCATAWKSFGVPDDRVYLGIRRARQHHSDESQSRTAGRYGFEPQNVTPEDVPLFGKLHQYEWNRTMIQTGNDGGHFGTRARPPQKLRAAAVSVFSTKISIVVLFDSSGNRSYFSSFVSESVHHSCSIQFKSRRPRLATNSDSMSARSCVRKAMSLRTINPSAVATRSADREMTPT